MACEKWSGVHEVWSGACMEWYGVVWSGMEYSVIACVEFTLRVLFLTIKNIHSLKHLHANIVNLYSMHGLRCQ